MHLAEGIITSPVVLGGGVLVACGGVAMGLRKMDEAHALRTAVLGSGFFVASLVHIPLFGVSVHLTLSGLLGVVLGWAAFPAVLVGLILQLGIFGFGGISTLGLNTCIMAIPAVVVHFGCRRAFGRPGSPKAWVGGVAGALAVVLSACILAAILYTGGDPFLPAVWTVLLTHIPVIFLEGAVTAAAVVFLGRVSPELLAGHVVDSPDDVIEEEAA